MAAHARSRGGYRAGLVTAPDLAPERTSTTTAPSRFALDIAG
jgi:hypothetical protein